MHHRPLWQPVVSAAGLALLLAGVACKSNAPDPQGSVASPPTTTRPVDLAGSQSCRECHAQFYERWSTSHHGLAMQPFTAQLARAEIPAPTAEIKAAGLTFRAEFADQGGVVIEHTPAGEKRYPIAHVMGGKNVYYFLTPLERGRLQILPIAYDVHRQEWFDTPASAVRHFGGRDDQPLDWRDPLFTFNTSCHSCHVSQLSTNYDLQADAYHTTWAEPGINCETCHGRCSEHVRMCQALPKGQKLAELKLISTNTFTHEQHNAACSICHAKAPVLTDHFTPGERFFDHFDLTTLEDSDFYPDGRDLGENYTYTGWRMNPCAIAGQLDCVHCHTSSGRNRFEGEHANDACLPCHQARVQNATAHTHHQPGSTGNQCVACHMPTTEFARMRRSDHSLRPPTPAATIAFKSPNACNLCHQDHDAAWADQAVREWHSDDYQAPVLQRAGLIAAARANDWSRLPEMLETIQRKNRDEVLATSLIRLLNNCPDARKWPVIIPATQDPSPLVRAAAVIGLVGAPVPEALPALLKAAGDDYRLVRIRAAQALAGVPQDQMSEESRRVLAAATQELIASFRARPDDWASHFNLGNFRMQTNELPAAVASFEMAAKLRRDVAMPLVNAAIVYARLGQNPAARKALDRALAIEPTNAAAHFNMGLLEAESGDLASAEAHLRAALKTDPTMAEAAFNLGLLLVGSQPAQGLELLRKAHALRAHDPRYAYTLAFYLQRTGDSAAAIELLQKVVAEHPDYTDAQALLAALLQGR